jgi:hypothetical protein
MGCDGVVGGAPKFFRDEDMGGTPMILLLFGQCVFGGFFQGLQF